MFFFNLFALWLKVSEVFGQGATGDSGEKRVPQSVWVKLGARKSPSLQTFLRVPNSKSQAWKVRAEAAEKELEELRSECKGGPKERERFRALRNEYEIRKQNQIAHSSISNKDHSVQHFEVLKHFCRMVGKHFEFVSFRSVERAREAL